MSKNSTVRFAEALIDAKAEIMRKVVKDYMNNLGFDLDVLPEDLDAVKSMLTDKEMVYEEIGEYKPDGKTNLVTLSVALTRRNLRLRERNR